MKELKENEVIILENPSLTKPCTKDVAGFLKTVDSYEKRVLFLGSGDQENHN